MWSWECFTPHPPVLVPQVGRGREEEARQSAGAMKKLGRILGGEMPSLLLILSPHAPFAGGITFSVAESYGGDFSMFGAPTPQFTFPGDPDRGLRLAAELSPRFPAVVSRKKKLLLDHGALVPLSLSQPERKKTTRDHSRESDRASPSGRLRTRQLSRCPRRRRAMGTRGQRGPFPQGDQRGPGRFFPRRSPLRQPSVEALRKNDPSGLSGWMPARLKRQANADSGLPLFF